VPDQPGEGVEELLHADGHFPVFGPKRRCDLPRVVQLAEFRLAVTHREGLQRSGHHALHQGGDGAGIDPAAQEHSQRHVAHQPHPDGLFQPAAALGDPLGVGARLDVLRRGHVPVALDRQARPAAVAEIKSQVMAGHQLADVAEQRPLVADVAEGKILGQQRLVEARRDSGMLQQRLDLGGEGEQRSVPVVVEGFDAEAVAGAEQRLGLPVPDGEGEHAAQRGNTARPVLLPGMQDGFGVAVRAVAVAGGFQGRAQSGVVEDLAVEDDLGRAVLVGHGLVAAGQVDDAEPAVSEGGRRVQPDAAVVRSAVAEDVRHSPEDGFGAGIKPSLDEPRDAAHRSSGPPRKEAVGRRHRLERSGRRSNRPGAGRQWILQTHAPLSSNWLPFQPTTPFSPASLSRKTAARSLPLVSTS